MICLEKQKPWGVQKWFPRAIYRPLLWLGYKNGGVNCYLMDPRTRWSLGFLFIHRIKDTTQRSLLLWLGKRRLTWLSRLRWIEQSLGWPGWLNGSSPTWSMLVALIFMRDSDGICDIWRQKWPTVTFCYVQKKGREFRIF